MEVNDPGFFHGQISHLGIFCIDYYNSMFHTLFISQAIKILDDEMQCDIIKIGNLVRNKVCIT